MTQRTGPNNHLKLSLSNDSFTLICQIQIIEAGVTFAFLARLAFSLLSRAYVIAFLCFCRRRRLPKTPPEE